MEAVSFLLSGVVMGISLRAYSRHRGVSLTAVQKAIATGRIHREPDGTIDQERADVEWEANTRPPRNTPAAEEAELTYRKAHRMRLLYEAKTAKLELDVRDGVLADADGMCNDVFTRARQVRDRLFTVPRRMAPRCASESDPAIISCMLLEAFTEALGSMASASSYIPMGERHG